MVALQLQGRGVEADEDMVLRNGKHGKLHAQVVCNVITLIPRSHTILDGVMGLYGGPVREAL